MQNQVVPRGVIVDSAGQPMQRAAEAPTYNASELAAIFAREKGISGAIGQPFRQNVWVYSSITLIANTLAQIPFGLWRPVRGKNRTGFVQVQSHPLLDLLRQPNDLMSAFTFVQGWVAHLLEGGNVWVMKDKLDSRGIPRSLMLFGIQHVTPIRERPYSPVVGWRLNAPGIAAQDIPLDDMIHSRLPNPYDPVLGLPPHWAMTEDLQADNERSRYDRAFFRNNATPDAVLTYKPGPLNDFAREQIRESWSEFHQGADKAGGVAILGGDFDFKVWGISHSQSQFLETRKFTREEVASIFSIPVVLLNSQESTGLSKSELDAARIMLYDQAVIPHSKNFEFGLTAGLIDDIAPNLIGAFDLDTIPVLREDLEKKVDILTSMVASGVPLNAAIQLLDLDLPPVEGGDVALVGSNLVPLADVGKSQDPEPAPIIEAQTTDEDEEEEEDDRSLYDNQTDDLFSLLPRMKAKLKRGIFDIRAEAIKKREAPQPFDVDEAKKKWVRYALPVSVAAFQLGYEQVQKSEGKISSTWLESAREKIEDVNTLLSEAQMNCKEIRFEDAEMNDSVQGLVSRLCQMPDEIYKDLRALRSSGNAQSDVQRRLTNLHTIARDVAKSHLIWCMNGGRRLASERLGATSRIVPEPGIKRKCNHDGLTHPGDPNVSLMDIIGCRCIVVVDGGA